MIFFLYTANLLKGEMTCNAEDCVQDAIEASYRRRGEFQSVLNGKLLLSTVYETMPYQCLEKRS